MPMKSADVHHCESDECVLRVYFLPKHRMLQPNWTMCKHNEFLQLPRSTADPKPLRGPDQPTANE